MKLRHVVGGVSQPEAGPQHCERCGIIVAEPFVHFTAGSIIQDTEVRAFARAFVHEEAKAHVPDGLVRVWPNGCADARNCPL